MSTAGFCQYTLQWTGPTGQTGSCWSSQWHSDVIAAPEQVLVLHICVTASLTVCGSAVFIHTSSLSRTEARLSCDSQLSFRSSHRSHSFCVPTDFRAASARPPLSTRTPAFHHSFIQLVLCQLDLNECVNTLHDSLCTRGRWRLQWIHVRNAWLKLRHHKNPSSSFWLRRLSKL